MLQWIPPEERRDTIVLGATYGYGGRKREVLYCAYCLLQGSELIVADVHTCSSLKDLETEIIDSDVHWALDLPFALPGAAYSAFSLPNWQALLQFAEMYKESEVEEYVRLAELRGSEDRCRGPGTGCRLTDALSGAPGPLARHGPDSLGTTHEGLRMLGRLRGRDVRVYPFDRPFPDRPFPGRPVSDTAKVYEVFPAHTRAWVGFEEGASVPDFVESFNKLEDRAVTLSLLPDTPMPFRGLDAVVASATLANALRAFDLQHQWDAMPANVSAREWEVRRKEGLIVRL